MDLIPSWTIFTWKLINKALPSCTRLRKRGLGVDTLCSVCKTIEEFAEHLFRGYSVVKHVWRASSLGINSGSNIVPIGLWVSIFLSYPWKHETMDDNRNLCFAATLWSIWIHRNEAIFKGRPPNPTRIIDNIEEQMARGLRVMCNNTTTNSDTHTSQPGTLMVSSFFARGNTNGGIPITIQTDGAWKKGRRQKSCWVAAVGWYATEKLGLIREGSQRVFATILFHAEMAAVWWALKDMKPNYTRMEVHMNSIQVVRAF